MPKLRLKAAAEGMPMITRRAALLGLAVSSTAGAAALPVVAEAAAEFDDPWTRAMRLARALSGTLGEIAPGGSLAVSVYGDKAGSSPIRFHEAEPFDDPRALAEFYAERVAQTIEASIGGEWRLQFEPDNGFVSLMRRV